MNVGFGLVLLLIIFDNTNRGLVKAIGNTVCGNAPSKVACVVPLMIPPWLNSERNIK